MSADSAKCVSEEDTTRESRERQILSMARSLDRFGREAESFLMTQLEQLETRIREFEREKAAWQRQLRQESSRLVQQRRKLERLAGSCGLPGQQRHDPAAKSARSEARASGSAPFRLLLQPCGADPLQVGLLLFEISKLNRDMGGRGVNFDLAGIRTPRRPRFSRRGAETFSEIIELHGESTLPLAPRGRHVALDVNVSERIEHWITFKARLLQAGVINRELRKKFDGGEPVKADATHRELLRDVSLKVDDAEFHEHGYSAGMLVPDVNIDTVQLQVERLEACLERLREGPGIDVHVEL